MLFISFHFSRIRAINVSHQKPTMSQSMAWGMSQVIILGIQLPLW